jgi:hypothetical protein
MFPLIIISQVAGSILAANEAKRRERLGLPPMPQQELPRHSIWHDIMLFLPEIIIMAGISAACIYLIFKIL